MPRTNRTSNFQSMTAEQQREFARVGAQMMAARRADVDPDKVTFGIEIECAIPSRNYSLLHIEQGGYHHGYPLPAPFPRGWTAQSDSSLSGASGQVMVEIVSPPLKGIEGLNQVVAVYDILNSNNAKVNSTCGLHVHIGVDSLLGDMVEDFENVADWVRRLVNHMSRQEYVLTAITGCRSRLGNRFCRSVKQTWQPSRLTARSEDKWSRLRDIVRPSDHEERYKTLNLLPLFNASPRRTVEFRLFAGTMNANKTVGYILTAIAMCQIAAERPAAPEFDATQTEPDTSDALDALHKIFGWTPTNAKFGASRTVWAKYGKAVLKNQRWNVVHFQPPAAGELSDPTPSY